MKLKITCPNCKKEFEANIEGANMPNGRNRYQNKKGNHRQRYD